MPADARFSTGNVGLAKAPMADLRFWRLLPPLLSANCTTRRTEHPHMVIEDGHHHLFTISHTETFAPGLTGPDGAHGFLWSWRAPSTRCRSRRRRPLRRCAHGRQGHAPGAGACAWRRPVAVG